MYNFPYQTVLIFSLYILFAKIIKTFWSCDVTDIRVLAHLEFKIHKDFKTVSRLHLLNSFKYFLIYILIHFVSKIRQEKY